MKEIDPAIEAAAYRVIHSAIEGVILPEKSVDIVMTDPPYDNRTQANIRSLKRSAKEKSSPMVLGFEPANAERRTRWASWIGHVTKRWAIVFSDHESSMLWAADLERAGLVYVRSAIWVRTGDKTLTEQRPMHSGAPQITGDRPAAGHEVIVLAHAKGIRMRWNGGGKAAIYTSPVVQGIERFHTTQKPLALMQALVDDFCLPGQILVDPFAGAGTTLVAAKARGVHAFGVELDGRYADYAARRVASSTGPA